MVPFMLQFYLMFLIIFAHKNDAKEFDIDMNENDILNAKMMPLDLFSIQINHQPIPNQTTSWPAILQTMSFHRKMMQQFMASDYLAQQITKNKFGIEKRIGRINMKNYFTAEGGEKNTSASETHVGAVKKLLYDDGSAQYKAWLERTTTLEDIQHQLEHKHAYEQTSPAQRRTTDSDINSNSDLSAGLEEADDGDITGYAFDGNQNASLNYDYPLHVHPLLPRWTFRHALGGPHLKEISKSGYENSYDDYSIHSTPPESSHLVSQSSKQSKEISIKDITDIALTTLAFLSFGMFILQVLMCITMNKDDGSNLMMLPMEATETSESNDGTEEIRRRKRSLRYNQESLSGVNQLSEIILTSVDNLQLASINNTNVENHLKFLCYYSAIGKEMPLAQGIWIPLYSLGSSWLASRVSNDYGLLLRSLVHMYKICN